MLGHEGLDHLDFEAIRRQFEVNALGPLRVTAALLAPLVKGSKVAIVSSRMGSIADNSSGGSYGYRMSKAAVNAAGRSLANDLAMRGIAVVILHPGFVRTAMTGHNGMVDPPESRARPSGPYRRAGPGVDGPLHAHERRRAALVTGRAAPAGAAHASNGSFSHCPRSAGPRHAQSARSAGTHTMQALVAVP